MLVSSAVALGVAPVFMPSSYSWVAHTTSESAGQGVAYAWVARAGFVLFGAGVLAAAVRRQSDWNRVVRALHGLFGLLMIAAAVFSSKPWIPERPFDHAEDLAHSVAASTMGVAFVAGVAVVAVRRGRGGRAWAFGAMAAAIILPMAMNLFPDARGLLQRLMFLVAYAWYIVEATRSPASDSN